ncbi:MAG: arylamine N-acetyltransferase [Oscillospiraceae bacterium]|nr:arylamine N-acetyltransferase [Oscillospiraceae bacterium]
MEKVKVEKYFKRIGLEMPETIVPDGQLLKKLHFAHCTTVPYENLDIIRGIPLRLDDEGLYQKVVEEGKGGYCFELNGLFAWLLRELGYKVTEYASRYLRGESSIPMRRHRVLRVEAADGVYCADVGIGEVCPRYPLKLVEGLEQPQFDECYRFDKDEFLGWVLMDYYKGQWRQFYSFTEEPQLPQDYVALSCYCEKHPDSPFIHAEMFSLKTATGRITLDGNVYKEFKDGEVTVKELSEDEMPAAYARFGLVK